MAAMALDDRERRGEPKTAAFVLGVKKGSKIFDRYFSGMPIP